MVGAKPSGGDPIDYLQLYERDSYLFDTVHERFQRDGELSAFDFFCILIWKSNRAKAHHARRLQREDSLEEAVGTLTSELYQAETDRERFTGLIEKWGFRLATASAILTVCYPDRFTVYDARVCGELGDFHELAYRTEADRLWEDYQAFIEQVQEAAPEGLSLRDKDRWLWGWSFAKQLERDLDDGFQEGIESG